MDGTCTLYSKLVQEQRLIKYLETMKAYRLLNFTIDNWNYNCMPIGLTLNVSMESEKPTFIPAHADQEMECDQVASTTSCLASPKHSKKVRHSTMCMKDGTLRNMYMYKFE